MIEIICGTNRPGSRSLEICGIVNQQLNQLNKENNIIDLRQIAMNEVNGKQYGDDPKPQALAQAIQRIDKADGLFVVVPEYNGSYPGILKHFIDHWSYPSSFEFRPVSFVGLGGRFGGLRPVEHLQQVFGYRNSFIYPERVFCTNVWNYLKDGKISDKDIAQLLNQQVEGFTRFIDALKKTKLHTNTRT